MGWILGTLAVVAAVCWAGWQYRQMIRQMVADSHPYGRIPMQHD